MPRPPHTLKSSIATGFIEPSGLQERYPRIWVLDNLVRSPATAATVGRTVALTAAICALCLGFGLGAALLVMRTDLPLRRLYTAVFALPLAVPGFVTSYAGYSAGLLYAPRSGLVSSFAGASVILSLSLYPYVFLPCVVALRGLDPAQEEVAHSLRETPGAALTRVVLPQLRPALAGGLLIVALHVLAEYGAMVQLGRPTVAVSRSPCEN